MKLSVVTGTLNRLEHLKKVIENTVDSSNELELILLDGGSTDGTIEYVKSLNNNRINLIEIGGRSSYPHFMNIGLRASKTEWIAQWNDDMLLINEWDDVYKLIDENEHDAYIFDWTRGNYNNYFDLKNNINIDPSTFGEYWIHFRDCMNFGIYRKDVFRNIGMYDNKFRYYECDHDMTTRCIIFGYKVINIHSIKAFEIITDKKGINYNGDTLLYWNNRLLYEKKIIPDTVEKLN